MPPGVQGMACCAYTHTMFKTNIMAWPTASADQDNNDKHGHT